MRVIYPDGTVVEVPVAMETADAAIRERYITARYVECHGAVTFKQTMPRVAEGVEDERNEAHGSRGRAGEGGDDLQHGGNP
jgi:hypothetical protein